MCDAVTIERDILKAYNSSLTVQLDKAIADKTEAYNGQQKAEKDRDKWKGKAKRRLKTVVTLIGIVIIETAIILRL